MKRALLFILTMILSLGVSAQGFVVNGFLKGSKRGTATLRIYFKDGNEQLDSAAIEKDGKFYFRGQILEPVPALLTLNDKKAYRLYLEPGKTIEIKLNPSGKKKTQIKGSSLTDKWYEIVTPKAKEDYDVHLERLDNWVINNPEDIFCADIIASYLAYKWDYDDLSRSLNTLKGEALNTYHYRHLTERLKLMQNLKVGGTAPDFTASDIQGKSQRLSSIVRKNKYTLLTFWASWSLSAREENPDLIKVYNKFKSAGFDVVGFSLDDDKNAWKQAVAEDKLPWTQLSELKKWESKAVKSYLLKTVPYNVLIDGDNKIVAFNLKPYQLRDKLAELTGSQGFLLEGEIAGLDEGVITLDLLKADGVKERMKTKIVNGLFVFEGYVDRVCMATLNLPTRSGSISFFMDNSKIRIEGDLNDIDNVAIEGSESNDEFLQIANRCNRQKNPMQCLMNYVIENPQSIYSPFILSSYLVPYLNNNELREIFSQLSGDATQMYQYDLLKKHIAELDNNEKLGEKVKDFSLSDVNGKQIKLMEFASQNECTLIHFWASWDVKSCEMNKELRLLYNKYKSEGFNIISVSLDDDRASWLKAIKTYGMQWTNVSDLKRWSSIIVMLYGLEYIPQNILINKEGRVIAKNISYSDLNQRLLLMLMK